MSVKGFPSNQKLDIGTGITNEFATVIPTDELRHGLDIPRSAMRVGAIRTAAASTGHVNGVSWIYDTATPAKKGDFIRFETGNNQYLEVPITKVETNRFQLSAKLTNEPAAGDTFYIMRYITQRIDTDGSSLVTVVPSPIAYVLDGVDTEVEQDTATPANSKPLPTIQLKADGTRFSPESGATETTLASALTALGNLLTELQLKADLSETQPVSAASLPLPTGAATEAKQDAEAVLVGAVNETAPASDTASSGLNGRLQRIAQRITSLIALIPASLGQKTAANSFAVTIASDQSAVGTKSPVNTSGSIVNTSLTATTASTANVPANAVGFIFEAPSTNTDNIRWCIGGTASTTVGMLCEPGRDSGFVPCAANISVCATVSGTNAFSIQWVLSA